MANEPTSALDGCYLGYDPGGYGKKGGAGNNGVAAIEVKGGVIVETWCCTKRTVRGVLEWFSTKTKSMGRPVRGIGIDTVTYWGSERNGLRGADCWLRHAFPGAKQSVIAPNGLYGAMCLNGMFVLLDVAKSQANTRPDFIITETHPKVLYFALKEPSEKYPTYKKVGGRLNWLQKMNPWLATEMGIERAQPGWIPDGHWLDAQSRESAASEDGHCPRNDHEWDAMISAWAAFHGTSDGWMNLAEFDREFRGDHLFFSNESVRYLWPPPVTRDDFERAWPNGHGETDSPK